MAGCTLGNGPISYASGSISAGATTSLLSTFTEVSNATLASGNRMYPSKIDYMTINDLYYTIESGSYAGTYYINRNDSAGINAYQAALTSGNGTVYFDQFKGYRHWPADNKFLPKVEVVAPDDHSIQITFGSTLVYSVDLAGSYGVYDPFGSTPDLCVNGPSSAGAFDAGAVNTNWTIYINVANKGQTQSSFASISVTDFHYGGASLLNTGLTLDSGNAVPWENSTSYSHDYWRVPEINITFE